MIHPCQEMELKNLLENWRRRNKRKKKPLD